MDIAIIGGGAAGISVIDAIIRQNTMQNGEITLTLIEPNKRVGPGRAYKGDGEYALLNRQARFMSIRSDEPSHFIDWIRNEADPQAAQQEFVPRALFGDYLTAQFHKQIEKSRQFGSPINILCTAATALYCASGKVRIVTSQGSSLKFDAAVLCMGTAEPTDIFGLSGSIDFIPQPYPSDMVDVRGHQIGRACCYSGFEPHSHGYGTWIARPESHWVYYIIISAGTSASRASAAPGFYFSTSFLGKRNNLRQY